jgi:tetratricopeptide (TPR) repeat protein
MARAAAKRNRGAGKAARPVAAEPKRARRKAEKTLEDELFFTRLRGHAKWAFALLAVVFAGSFVFLGVGSGNAGLGDVFSNVFTGGSAPSIDELQEKLAESPRDKAVLTDLAQALERDGRYAEAIAAYRTYLTARPKDEDVLASLALVYQTQASQAANDATIASRDASLAAPGAQFRPGAGALGQALGSFVDPLGQAASADAERRYQEAVGRYQTANREALGVYKQLSTLAPEDSGALLRWAQAAEGAGEVDTALTVYRRFVNRFPTDPLVVDARQKIKELEAQKTAQQATGGAEG